MVADCLLKTVYPFLDMKDILSYVQRIHDSRRKWNFGSYIPSPNTQKQVQACIDFDASFAKFNRT